MEETQHGRTARLPVVVEDGITLENLVLQVQGARGKRLEVHELPALSAVSGALCGLWLDTEAKDIILLAPSESPLHRQQFLLHELAHMILQHDRDDGVFVPEALLPNLEGLNVKKALARDAINNRVELEAEALADELAAAIRRKGQPPFFEVFG